ncbi:hypothetical protein BDR04DRAFT_1108344, partial [Suillus decipiens]
MCTGINLNTKRWKANCIDMPLHRFVGLMTMTTVSGTREFTDGWRPDQKQTVKNKGDPHDVSSTRVRANISISTLYTPRPRVICHFMSTFPLSGPVIELSYHKVVNSNECRIFDLDCGVGAVVMGHWFTLPEI